jgi:hypothetical protein
MDGREKSSFAFLAHSDPNDWRDNQNRHHPDGNPTAG